MAWTEAPALAKAAGNSYSPRPTATAPVVDSTPSMKHHGDAEFAAEPAGIAAELEQGLRRGLEQQPVDEGRMALGDSIELMRQGEHDMPVRDVEQVGALALDPSGLCQGLALGAVTIAARCVLNRHRPAVVAVRLESAQSGGTAAHERIHRAQLLGRQPMRLAIGVGTLAQDVRHLQRRTGGRRRVDGMGHRSGSCVTRELQQVQRRRRG